MFFKHRCGRKFGRMTSHRLCGMVALVAVTVTLSSCDKGKGRSAKNDAVAQLCRQVAERRAKIVVDTNETEIVWSDGAILEVGTNFPAGVRELISGPVYYHDVRSFVAKFGGAKAPEWKDASVVPSARGEPYVKITSSDGKVSAAVASAYVNYLNERYPTAKVRIKGEFDPVVFVVGDEVRASVMPVRVKPASR
jgi:hypothetical protein